MVSARLALTADDFDAYGVESGASNVLSRRRLVLKRRALGWARSVVARLAEIDLVVEVAASDESLSSRNRKSVDCQWIWFGRKISDRAEVERVIDAGRAISVSIDAPNATEPHALLALRLDSEGVEVCFTLRPEARIDLENLRGRLDLGTNPRSRSVDCGTNPRARSVDANANEIASALAALPDEFTIGAAATTNERCSEASAASLGHLVDDALAGARGLWIGWRVPRETAVLHAEILDDQLADALVALAPIYRLVVWTRDNDFINLEERIEGARLDRARAHAGAQEKNARWLAGRAETQADRSDRPSPTPAANARSSAGSVEKGARVRVRFGPFADKVGIVSELDGRGAARVMLGLLSSRFSLDELEPVVEGRDRPAFQSSHRRPVAPPSATRGIAKRISPKAR